MLALAICFLTGCDPADMGAFRGVVQKVGAKVVDKSSDEEIRQMFEQANSQCPMKMDPYTTLEEVKMLDDKNIEFYYRVNDQGRRLVKGLSKDRMRANAVEHMRGNPMAVAVAERDLSIQHIYEDKYGGHILSYTINKDVLAGRQTVASELQNPFVVKPVKAEKDQDLTETDAEANELPDNEPAPKSESEVASADDQPLPSVEDEPVVENLPAVANDAEIEQRPAPAVPQKYVPQRRNMYNPAGVQSNPYFQ